MNFMEYFESRRSFWISVTVMLCLALLVVTSLRNPADYDGYWHLRMGMDWVLNGLSPWVDHYSYTFAGQPVKNPPFLFQALLFGLVALFGESWGMVACKLLAYSLVLGLVLVWLRQLNARVVVYLLILPLLVVVLQFRVQVRPELFSYALVVLAFILYERTRLRLSFNAMAPMIALLWFWSVYHSSILGYVIAFGLFADIAIALLKKRAGPRDWGAWLGWGLAAVGVGFLNPDFSHVLIETLLFPDDWAGLIQEYRSPLEKLNIPAGYLLMVVALASLLGSLVQKRTGYVLILMVYLYAGLSMSRMTTPAGLVCIMILAPVFNHALLQGQRRTTNPPGVGVVLIALVVAGFGLLQGVYFALGFMKENRSTWTRFPQALVSHYLETGKRGNVFNAYELGGYLLYRLSPDSKVYIDGRTGILYPVEHFRLHEKASEQPEVLAEQADRYDIQHAIVLAGPANAELMQSAGFELDFLGVRYSLFSRSGGALAEFGTLWAQPECWARVDQDRLSRELAPFLEETRQTQPTHSTLKLVAGYQIVDDPLSFLEFMVQNVRLDDSGYRFLAHRAVELGKPELSLFALSQVQDVDDSDRLVIIHALLELGDGDRAASELEQLLARPGEIDPDRANIALLGLIHRTGNMSTLGPRARGRLEQSAASHESASPQDHLPFRADVFCQ